MPKHSSADVNAVSAPTAPGSVDETLKAKTPKKPKGWKKWKRRLSRVFKGKKKTKETTTSGQNHAKSAQHPERERARDPADEKLSLKEESHYDEDDDGMDESPAVSEKEVDPQRHHDSREWRRSGRSEESSYVSEHSENWEEDEDVEHEPEDNGEEYEDDEDPHSEAPQAAEPHPGQHVEEEEVEYEDDEQQNTSIVQEPQTDEYDDDQELEHVVVVAEDEYEEEYEEELEVSAELRGSVASEGVDTAPLNHSSGEGERVQHSEEEEEAEEEEEEEEDDGGVDEDEEQLQGYESSLNSPTEVTPESEDTVTPSHETSGLAEEEEKDEYEQNEESEYAGGDDEQRPIETVDLHVELSDDLHTVDQDQAADIDDASAGQASPQEEDTASDRSEVDTDELSVGDAVVADIVVVSAPGLSLEQQQELAAIVALVPPHLSLVRDVSAWCVAHTATTTRVVASTECQLFLLSVESGKWKLAELLAEKLHRDHIRAIGSRQDDQVISAILAQCAA